MSVQSFADLVTFQSTPVSNSTEQVAYETPELTLEFLEWHRTNIGPVVNAQESTINRHIMKASALAARFTRNAVSVYINYGVAWEDIEPLIKEGIFIYVAEEINPAYASKNEKPIENAEALMLEYFYSQDLVKA